tara:strand:- start:283 stop:933 length:651 start_codon:yes stop_codon:yes gene_type:complete
MVITGFLNETLTNIYVGFSNQIPQSYMPYIILAFYTVIITIYAIFIWKFYKFLARRNIIKLNLNKYNRTEHPFLNKLLASVFFLVEYIIIVPIIVFFWFSILALFLLLLSKNQNVTQILIISAAIVAATRMTAYYSGDLSKDLAKMFPFTVLAIFLLDPDFFAIEKTISRFAEIPSLLGNILVFLVFIAILEIVMRGLFTIVDLFSPSNEEITEIK